LEDQQAQQKDERSYWGPHTDRIQWTGL
jgi:hypothetical protein